MDDTDLQAFEDFDDLYLGEANVNTYASISDDNLQVLGLADGVGDETNALEFSVLEGTSGEVTFEVSQTALVSVAEAFSVEVYNGTGELVYIDMTDNNPLVGDVAGVQLLGLTGNDILQDTVSGLESGD